MPLLLIIGHTYPESSTTAAGTRMMQLIEIFQKDGYEIIFATTASKTNRSVDLSLHDVKTVSIALNSDSFNQLIKSLTPDIVMYDRYMTEEQFGWRVTQECPDVTTILDTEDLHFLRKARQQAVKKNENISGADIYTDTAKREIASILRCDLTLIISEVEMDILKTRFNISGSILYYLPIFAKVDNHKNLAYDDRANFMTIGNHLHAPNKDAVLQLKKEIWPLIRTQLPLATLSIYGNYAPAQILQLHNEREGFLIKGWAENIKSVFSTARLCLAPLRYGAGLKGKIIDAMIYGTPVVSSSIGAEGINGDLPFCGAVSDDPASFATAAVALYQNESMWKQAQENGINIINSRFKKDQHVGGFYKKVKLLNEAIDVHRRENFIGQILQHQSHHATKYMSKWIEEKNKKV